MKVSDILRIKGSTLYTTTPEDTLAHAAAVMAEKDIGSLVVITSVYRAMDAGPLICTMETEMDDVRRMMLERHARYMPVMDKGMLMGVISFYDVAKTVVDTQNFENKLLKAYIRDWPEQEGGAAPDAA